MANKYANLIGTNLIKDEYTKINTGFDAVETDINTVKTDIANHGTAADPHDQYALDTDLATLQTEVDEHKAETVTDSGGVHGLVYEEGTWTPTLSFSGINGETTYSTQVGTYVKINSIVSLFFYLVINVKDESLEGLPEIKGLPFSNKVTGMLYGAHPVRLSNCNFNKDQLRLTFSNSSGANNFLRFYKNTTQTSIYDESDIQNGFTITGYISYEI